MGLGVPSSWLEKMILPTGGGLGLRHSFLAGDAASPFLPRGGFCSPWRAAHSLPPRRRGPCRNEPVCWEHTFFLCAILFLMQTSLQRSILAHKKNRKIFIFRFFSAEREGFEPPDPLRSTVFKTAAIDHSATSPSALGLQI